MFSIVIPYFNTGDYFFKTIESLENQEFQEFEVIIVDDGSNKPLTVSDFPSSLDVRVINTPNQGVSVARNIGASLAKNNYLIFLDAGDYYKPDFLKAMQSAIASSIDFDLVASAFYFHRNGDDILADTGLAQLNTIFSYEQYISHICENNYLFHLCSSVFTRESFFKMGGFTPKASHGEDHELILKILKYSKKCYFVNRPLFCYSLDDEASATRSNRFISTYAHSRYLLSLERRNRYENEYLVNTLVDNFFVNGKKGFLLKGMRQIINDLPIVLYIKCMRVCLKRAYFYAKK